MKKTLLQVLAIFCALIVGLLPVKAESVANYTEGFDALDVSEHDFAPIGWGHIVDYYSDWYAGGEYYVEYTAHETGGQDGGGYLEAGSQNVGESYDTRNVDDLLVTPALTGTTSMYLKLSKASGSVKFYTCTLNNNKFSAGSEITVDEMPELSDSEWTKVTLPALKAGTYVGIRLENACIDSFTAESAEVDKSPSMEIVSVNLVSETEPVANEENKFLVAFDVVVKNNGPVALNPGDENYSLSIIDDDNTIVYGTTPVNVPLAVGETLSSPIRVETLVDATVYAKRDRYDVRENLKGTSEYGGWIEPIPYIGILEIRNENNQDVAGETFDFGIVKDVPASITFNLKNVGGKPLTVSAINAPEGFTFSQSVPFVVGASEVKPIVISLGTESKGSKSGEIVFVNDGTTEPSISVVGSVPDEDTWYEDFEDELSELFICPTDWTRTNYPSDLQTETSKYWLENSNSSDPKMLISPKLVVAEGDALTFKAAKRNQYNGFLNVYYSADRKNWTKVKELSINSDDPNCQFSSEKPSYGSSSYKFSTFAVDNIPAGEWYIGFESGYALLDDLLGYKLATVEHDLYVSAETLPLKAVVNNPYTATVTVKNMNAAAEAAGTYTAKLYVDGVAVKDVAGEEEWASGEEKTFTLSYTPHAEGVVEAYVEVAVGGYTVQSGKVTVEVSKEVASEEVKVGETTTTNSNTPLAMNWKLSQSQTIYTAEKLGIAAGSEIVSLGYDGYCTSDKDITFHIKVWMMNTTATAVSVDSPVDPSAMTLVYEGDHTIEPQGSSSELVRMLDLPFNDAFVYDGTNLCVMVESTADDYKAVNFANESAVSNMSMYRRHDVELPTSWTTAGLPVAYFGTSREVPTISGQVTDASTTDAIAGATVELVSGEVIYSTTTDDAGNYSMEVFQSDKDYTMTVSAEGYEPVTETVSLAAGSVVKNVALSTGAKTVSGVVTDAVTGDPIAYAQVMMQSGAVMFMGMTDNQGHYSFEVTEPDLVYTLTASYYGYETYKEENVSVANGSIVRDIALEKLTLSGVVTDAKTNEPLAGVRILLSDGWWTEEEVTTDENGAYSFVIGDDTSEYTLTASLDGYNSYEKSGIVFTEGSVVENIALEPIVTTVSGVVTDAETGDPIAYAQVMMQSGAVMFMGMTDNQGHYSFEVTEPDLAYTLTASYYGYETYKEENVSVANGSIVRDIALEKLTLSGVVTDAKTNEPLAGVRILLSDGWWTEEEVTTDESGAYSFAIGDDTSEFLLTASLEGYNEYKVEGITFAEGSQVVNIALEPIVTTVSGVVTDAVTNEPLEGAQVMLQSGWVMFMGTTDAEGHYSFEVTETDLDYTLTASATGYRTYTEENVSVADGSIVRDIALEKLTLSGVVTDAKTNEPLAGVRVMLSDGWLTELETTTDESGAYSFDIADDSAEYTLTASLDGYNNYELTGITFEEGSKVVNIAMEQMSGVGMLTADGLYVKGVNNAIEVVAPGKAIVNVYDLSGRLIRSVEVGEGKTLIEGFVGGVYLVNHVKVLVK